jgi:DNA-binding FadR family transcriptional regulator
VRFEATIPDNRATAVLELAEELGLSRSQLMDEALALFLKAVVEVRRGRRLVTLDPSSSHPACELATPTLSALEWAQKPEKLEVSAAAFAKVKALAEAALVPGPRLRAAARRHGK